MWHGTKIKYAAVSDLLARSACRRTLSLRKTSLFSQLFLCLSGACLGKRMHFIHKMASQKVAFFLPLRSPCVYERKRSAPCVFQLPHGCPEPFLANHDRVWSDSFTAFKLEKEEGPVFLRFSRTSFRTSATQSSGRLHSARKRPFFGVFPMFVPSLS